MRVPPTSRRVTRHTDEVVNRTIRDQTECRIRHYAEHPDEIGARLTELDDEWDIERALETNASILAFSGIVLGATVSKKFYWLSAAITGFLAQHAVQGWCPPLPILRRLGYRTQSEIEAERYALRFLRGDFDDLKHNGERDVSKTMATVLESG